MAKSSLHASKIELNVLKISRQPHRYPHDLTEVPVLSIDGILEKLYQSLHLQKVEENYGAEERGVEETKPEDTEFDPLQLVGFPV